jgi:transketolase
VKICASHAGLTLGEDGATHQILEDIGMMSMLPGMTVINPCDYNQTKAATLAIAQHEGPVYLRFGRPKVDTFTSPEQSFEIGKAWHVHEGKDLTIIATGHLLWKAVQAAKQLETEGYSIDLINIHTIKPLDEDAVVRSARKTGKVITCEEHQIAGGLGSIVSQTLSKHHPVPMDFVGVRDRFGESGTPDQLMAKYGLDVQDVYRAARKMLG